MIEYQITQLTDNDLVDTLPQISGNNIVWRANDGNDDEIFFYDGNNIIQITDNNLFDVAHVISGNNIAWVGSISNPLENSFADVSIFFYDGNTTLKLGDVGTLSIPAISGNNVVWGDILNSEVLFYDGSNTTKIGDSFFPVFLPSSISGNNVVWTDSDGNDAEVFLYDGSNVIQITDNNLGESTPLISGNNIAWTGNIDGTGDLNRTEIFLYDGNTTIQLTDNDFTDLLISISGNNVVWIGNDGNDNEIFLYNGNTTIQLSDNTIDDFDPFVSGNNVIWEANDGNDDEIFLYDGNTTIQLTDNEIDDSNPDISGDSIVWEADDEIFLAIPTTTTNPEPDDIALKLTGGTAKIAYVAYYGRPADKGGLDFWNDGLTNSEVSYSPRGGDPLTGAEQDIYNNIVNQFGNSAEADRLFGAIDSNRDKVNQVYQFAFNRDGDDGGLDFWTEQIDLGNVTLATFALEVALGAQNEDIVVLNNKINSADLFSNSIDTEAEIEAYRGFTGEIFGRDWLGGLGDTASSQTQVDEALINLVNRG